jgi:hypothetical protein
MAEQNQQDPAANAQESPEQKAAREAAAKKEAEVAEKARLERHVATEKSNWITVQKGGERLQINKATLAAHLQAGWKVVE